MKKSSLEQWVVQLLATEEQEISCSDCFDSLAEYVDQQLAHTPPDARSQRVAQHLGQCRVCREEYEMLKELVSHQEGGAN